MFDIDWIKSSLINAYMNENKEKIIRILSLLKDLQITQKNISKECDFPVFHFECHEEIQPLISEWENKLEKWDE